MSLGSREIICTETINFVPYDTFSLDLISAIRTKFRYIRIRSY